MGFTRSAMTMVVDQCTQFGGSVINLGDTD